MLIRIASENNARLKLVRKLRTRKGRMTERKFAAEGINLFREAISRGIPARFVLISEGCAEADALAEESAAAGIDACMVTESLFRELSDGGDGIDVIAVVDMPDNDPEAVFRLPEGANVLVLDRIQDPGNLGTMIRTAAAAGYGMILAVKGTADIYSAKVLRATAGMIFDMPIAYTSGPDETVSLLRSADKRIAAAAPGGDVPYYRAGLARDTALIIGNEGGGVSRELMDLADVRVSLPMKAGTESLNAAVSAAILMYEAVRNEDL